MKNENILGAMKAFLIFGDLVNEPLSKRVEYNQRIVFATMRKLIPGWEAPIDWDSLTDEAKMERLEKLQSI